MFSSKVTFFSAWIPGGSGAFRLFRACPSQRAEGSTRTRHNSDRNARKGEPSKPRWLVEVLSLMAFVETKVQLLHVLLNGRVHCSSPRNEGSRMVHKQFSW